MHRAFPTTVAGGLTALLVMATATLAQLAKEESMEARCRREILELHEFFERWFNAELKPTDAAFARFAEVMDEAFRMITPEGGVVDREPLTQGLRRGHGQWRDAGGGRIWIENVQVRRQHGEWALATYEEWQEVGGTTRARLSTALFGRRDDRPNGVVWLHLHEVWMPAESPAGAGPAP